MWSWEGSLPRREEEIQNQEEDNVLNCHRAPYASKNCSINNEATEVRKPVEHLSFSCMYLSFYAVNGSRALEISGEKIFLI